MKGLIEVAVLGLVAVPSISTLCTRSSRDDRRPTTTEEVNASKLAFHSDGIAERMATSDELERIRCELGHINAALIAQPKSAL
jgi:hypothetical protein